MDDTSAVEEMNSNAPILVEEMNGNMLSAEDTIINSNYKEYEEEMDTSDEEVSFPRLFQKFWFFFWHFLVNFLRILETPWVTYQWIGTMSINISVTIGTVNKL